MMTSELIQPHHLTRQAIVYVRQSSAGQVVNHRESLKLQYALRERAGHCGWQSGSIDVIDADLGLTGSTTVGRQGFQELVTRVTLGQVGIILSHDVTRLARNCSDWYQLLDICGYRQCLIADADGIYDPATINGRLLLGLKGQISELDIQWRTATIATVASILKNPAYAGAFVYGRTRSVPKTQTPQQRTTRRLPVTEWKICIPDKYPAYIDWSSFQKIQAMIQDNYSEYDKNKTRGVPRPGKALLHGLVYCGECGHKMLVQYKGGTRYICNFLRQKYQVPVCQCLPADTIDDYVVKTFFEALSPMELDLCAQAIAAADLEQEQARRAHEQQLERLRYQARLAERQYQKADPDNRLVAAELENRWEAALQDLKRAEEQWQRVQDEHRPADMISPALRESFADVARGLPQLWQQGVLSQQRKKALLRCLIDKVVIHRSASDVVKTRIVWRGGDTTCADIPIVVASVARLSCGRELEQAVLELFRHGKTDEAIADELTRRGFRSPRKSEVLPATVRGIRLKHRLVRPRPGSRPRRVDNKLTLPDVARRLAVPVHWLYQRIEKGVIEVPFDPDRKLYVFPDDPATLTRLKDLKAGKIESVRL